MGNRGKRSATRFILATFMILGPAAVWAGFLCNGWRSNGFALNGIGSNALPANGLAINGTTDIASFSVARDQLMAVVIYTSMVNRTPIHQQMTIPIKVLDATCELLKLQLDSYEFDFERMHIKVDPVGHEIRPMQSASPKLREMLCLYAKMKTAQAPPKDWAAKLDRLREF